MKGIIIGLSAMASILAVSKWGVFGLLVASIILGVIVYAAFQVLKWWQHRQFIKWCARRIWNVVISSEYPDDNRVLKEAKRIIDGLIESGNPLRVRVHAVIHKDNSFVTWVPANGEYKKTITPAKKKMKPEMPDPASPESFEEYFTRLTEFKRIDRVDRDFELSQMVDSGEISREFYEKYVLNQDV